LEALLHAQRYRYPAGRWPVLILCPSTLTLQWQVELADRLGVPSAVWSSTKKVWMIPGSGAPIS